MGEGQHTCPRVLPTPSAIVDRLAHTIAAVDRLPDVREKIAAAGAEPAQSAPAEFRRFLETERSMVVKIARDVNIRID